MPRAGPWWNGLGNRGSDFDAEPRRHGGRRGEAEGSRKPGAETAEIPLPGSAARTRVEDWREHNDGKPPSSEGFPERTQRKAQSTMPRTGPWWNGLGNRGSDFDAEPRRHGGRRGEAEGNRKTGAETAEIPLPGSAARTRVEDWREHNDGKSPSSEGFPERTQRKAQRKPWRIGARKSPSFARIGRLKPAPPKHAPRNGGMAAWKATLRLIFDGEVGHGEGHD